MIILLGDSIVQRSWTGWAQDLALMYVRKADVINRGFSGFTSKHGAIIAEQFLASNEQAFVFCT